MQLNYHTADNVYFFFLGLGLGVVVAVVRVM